MRCCFSWFNDVNIGGGISGAPGGYYPPYGKENNQIKIERGESDYLTDLIVEKTFLFLDEVNDSFFLHYTSYALHTYIHAVDSLLYKYENKPEYKGQKNPKYATMVENIDRNIGLLVNKLIERNFFQNSLIIFTSDNGGYYGKITMQKSLRAGKGSYYEGGIRVTFSFLWKDKINAGKNFKNPISHLDIFPTIMDLLQDDSMDDALDGDSLLPLIVDHQEIEERTFSQLTQLSRRLL